MNAASLGSFGPIPLPELDYILCDDVTVPHSIVCLSSFAPCATKNVIKPMTAGCPPCRPSRAWRRGCRKRLVYTCASPHHYKLTEGVWDGWCRILAATEGSLLWRIDDSPESRAVLTAGWRDRG